MSVLTKKRKDNNGQETVVDTTTGSQQHQTPYGTENPDTVTGTTDEAFNNLTGLAALQQLYGNAIPLDVGSGVLNTYLESFRERYAEKKKANHVIADLAFLGLPQETLGLPYSGIAVCYLHNHGVTVHTLVLEDDGPVPEPRTFNISQYESVQVTTTAADTYNEAYYNVVIEQVQARYGSNIAIVDGGMQVVYRTINLEDVNAVNRILTAASNAAVGATSLRTDGSDIEQGRTLANTLNRNGIKLHASVNTSPERMVTPNGLPVRRDIVVRSLATVPGATQNNLRGTRGGGFNFSEVSAFATLEYVIPEPPVFNPYNPQPPQPQSQRYIPRIVMTNITSDGIQTLPSVLLGISTASVIQEGFLWTEPFRPAKGRNKNDIDIHDIGAIGYDIPELNEDGKPGKINTTTNEFDNAAFYRLMASAVMPSPMYSIDIEEAGSLSWLTAIFKAAAGGDPEANTAIIEACDSLTNNVFSKYFEGGTILQSDENRVFLGTYRPHGDTVGELRDIRDLDYLAILNICGEDPRIVESFEKTQRASGGPIVARLAELQSILEEIIGSSLTIKGYANRYTFHHTFIEALAKSTREAKIAPMFSNLPVHVQENARARVSHYQWAMVQQQNVMGVYQGNAGQTAAGQPLQPFQPMWNPQYHR